MMVKIVHLISSLKRGGRERQIATIVGHSSDERYPSKIIYFNSSNNDYIGEYNLEDLIIKVNSVTVLKRLFELNSILKKENPDIVYTWGNIESIFILILKPLHHFLFINGSIRHGVRSKKFSHYFRTLILHLSQNIIANSYAGLGANNLKRGKVLYNGIDKKFINKINLKEKLAKRKTLLKIKDEKLVLISVANLVPYKDYFSILLALKELKEEGLIFHYIILGDGPLRTKLENRIEEYDLVDEIAILGSISNVHEYLQLSDIFIHSSKGEGCSNAILEAMAAGLPIVASNTGGTSEIVTPENGILFEYQNILALKNALAKFFTDKKMIEKFGEKSNQIVKENFSIERMMADYYRIISTILSIK